MPAIEDSVGDAGNPDDPRAQGDDEDPPFLNRERAARFGWKEGDLEWLSPEQAHKLISDPGFWGPVHQWDQAISDADAVAALAITSAPDQSEVGELAHLQPALAAALAARFEQRVVTGQYVKHLPDWNPRPGGVDVMITHDGHGSPRIGIELKSYKLDETIWDILKMASLRRMTGVDATYVIASAPASRFGGTSDCAALFHSPVGEATLWETSAFFRRWPKAWADLLTGGSARPTRVPRTIVLELTCIHDVVAFPGWQVRALRVENPVSDDWLVISSTGWPSMDPD